MRSARASSVAGWRRSVPVASRSRSRTTSDFEILRPRDSASISATSGSGKRTVSVFMERIVLRLCQKCKTERDPGNDCDATGPGVRSECRRVSSSSRGAHPRIQCPCSSPAPRKGRTSFAFPIRNMPESVRLLTWIDPLRYYLVVVRAIFLKGGGIGDHPRGHLRRTRRAPGVDSLLPVCRAGLCFLLRATGADRAARRSAGETPGKGLR